MAWLPLTIAGAQPSCHPDQKKRVWVKISPSRADKSSSHPENCEDSNGPIDKLRVLHSGYEPGSLTAPRSTWLPRATTPAGPPGVCPGGCQRTPVSSQTSPAQPTLFSLGGIVTALVTGLQVLSLKISLSSNLFDFEGRNSFGFSAS